MPNTSVGVYIGKNFVDVVSVSGSLANPTITGYVKKEIKTLKEKPYTFKDDLNKKISHLIKLAINELRTKPDKVFTVMPEAGIMVRHFDMPILPRSEQAQAIRFEARKYIPFKVEDVISDFKIITASKESKLMRVFFAAAQKAEIELQLKVFQDAGVKVSGIDISPFALLRAINAVPRSFKKDEAVALLTINAIEGSTNINIIEANYPAISRDVPISATIETLPERLISELRLSFDYYKRKPLSKEIKKLVMVVCGKDEFPQLDKKLAEELNIAIEIIDASGVIRGGKLDSIGAVIAAGAAMNGLGRDVYAVNLLPTHAKTRVSKIKKEYSAAVAVAAASILLTLAYSIYIVSVPKSEYKIALEKSKTLPAPTQLLSINALKTLKDNRAETLDFIKSLLSKRIYFTEKLERIATNLPDGAWITSLEFKQPPNFKISMTLQGKIFLQDSSQQMAAVNKFLESLKQDKIFMEGFGYCELGNLRKETTDMYEVTNYSITCGSEKQENL